MTARSETCVVTMESETKALVRSPLLTRQGETREEKTRKDRAVLTKFYISLCPLSGTLESCFVFVVAVCSAWMSSLVSVAQFCFCYSFTDCVCVCVCVCV